MDEARSSSSSSSSSSQAVCGQEALDLLNCVTDSSQFDQDKCLRLLESLRQCVLAKKVKKFSLPERNLNKS